jgi:protein O-GlcNAc transferase
MENSEYQISDDLNLAVRLHRDGDLEGARRAYSRILSQDSKHPDALHLLGVVAYQNGDINESLTLISRAIQLAPEQASYYLNLGNAYRESNLFEQAVRCFEKAIDLNPDYADAYFNIANTFFALKKFESAIRYYQDAVRLNPDLIEAYLNLGQIFEQQGMTGQAISSYRSAMQNKSDCTAVSIRLGSLLQRLDNHAEAIQCFRKAVGTHPTQCYRLYNNMGASYRALGRTDDAVDCFEMALKLNPAYAPGYYNLGIEYHLRGDLDKSIQVLEQALALKPDHCDALNLLVHLLQRTCDWEKLQRFAAQLDRLTESALKNQTPTAEAVYTNVLRHADPSLNFSLAQNRSRNIVQQISGNRTNYTLARPAGKFDKITLGYFSADLRNHPIAHLIRGIFGQHDRDQFKVYCYSYGKDDGSRYRHQIMRDCDRFVDVRKLSSRDIADRIYADGVCILIDLMGHTTGNRLDVCALKPAPIQVTYLGFPGTTGADFMDYIITDPIVSPGEHAPFYSEKFVYMPHCYQVNNNRQEISQCERQRVDFGLPENGFVFSSFNQPVKIEPVMFDCWMKILKRVPGSVLWLLWDNRSAEDNLRQAAQNKGIDPDRLVFGRKVSKEDHLARMRLADLALDTRVYNGHTTTSDSLWAGVPVITIQGTHFASRVSASIIDAIGLQELITHDLNDYEDLAVHLASNPDELKSLQKKLFNGRKTKPLFDTAGFTQNIESAFTEMWQIYQTRRPPRPIDVRKLKGMHARATACLGRVDKLNPETPEALFDLAVVHGDRGEWEKAIYYYQRVLEIAPDSAATRYNLASMMAKVGRLDDAVRHLQKSLRIKPDNAAACNNLGLNLKALGKIDEAIRQFRTALEIDPTAAHVHLNLAVTLLLIGEFSEGWQEYDWRFDVDAYRSDYRYRDRKMWTGKSFKDKCLLVHDDQGLGDSIQFVRFLPLVKKMGGTLIFETRKELIPLLKAFPGIDLLLERPAEGQSNLKFDYYIPLMSIPGRMGTRPDSIPVTIPYLFAEADKCAFWQEKMKISALKIGLVWAGNPVHVNDDLRSCALERFSWLQDVSDISIFGLQKIVTPAEETQLNKMGVENFGPQFQDFSDTAAVIENLDLVITVDTAVAHLSGAMGKSTWLLLPFDPDWRWMTGRSDSPWYPTVQLFRQSRPGDWNGVMSTVCNALKKQVQLGQL